MSKGLTPQEKDRRASLAAEGRLPAEYQEPVSESAESVTPAWLWGLVGIIVLISLVAGGIAGFMGGRWYERKHSTPVIVDTSFLLGAQLIDADGAVTFVGVTPGGPSDQAGIIENDQLVSIDGETTDSAKQAEQILSKHTIGDSVLVTIERNHRFEQYTVVLGIYSPVVIGVTAIPPIPPQQTYPPPPPGQYADARLGIYYRMLEPGDPFDVDEGALIVSLLGTNNPAELAGLKIGDIILQINNESITGDNNLESVLDRFSGGETVTIVYFSDGAKNEVAVTLGHE
ncbi:MAG: PDZ domain-containing protein [Anaerolineae bacterium]|nr:PDZ domain-containing protein [Anaerolineae bacterium]